MIDVQQYIDKLEVLKRKFEWFIDGAGIHCLPIRFVSVPAERIVELYNVEMDFFDSKQITK